ncbi:Transcription initiation factor TFIID subunit 4b [Zea mays]|uniref:Transcription initiation factor TFIID subunit 4b n=1 Tax=Zea mays TaxID=4577 RepID=A0A1D6KM90_MAIZE|nr:Transcription initiation factor TFIID subunit 4b [Zea mays]
MTNTVDSILCVYTKVLKPSVGLRNTEQQQQYRKESAYVGQMVCHIFSSLMMLQRCIFSLAICCSCYQFCLLAAQETTRAFSQCI